MGPRLAAVALLFCFACGRATGEQPVSAQHLDRTYGKGVVQQLTYNTDGSAMKVTTARYLTPHSRVIDGIGLAPDVPVTENEHARYGDPAADAQLAAAIGIVQAKARL